ncbi:DoxX family protein [Shimia thalassica]|uniref:DoxX family protein n=1 Tax=Shimia thalassica TaxID=1715693 RepID=UPI0026E25FD3|nr:DoxX family protein [Shimia thalassica]MDO6484289.1 DoxX family protein [Shimia thalassica]
MTLSIITGVLSAFFLFASSIKIFGWQDTIFRVQLEMFESYGLNRTIMRLVGFVELFGAVSIWFSDAFWGPLGALALMATSVGAIGCHLIFDTWKQGVPAMITLTLSSVVFWATKQPLLTSVWSAT